MGINRRKMLGTVVGSAIAGPDMVKQAFVEGSRLVATPPAIPRIYADAGSETKQAASAQHQAETIAKLKRIISGDIRDEDRNYPTEGPPVPYESLKSISSEARNFMRNRAYERKWRERLIADAKKSLEAYDKTGFLRYIF